jgi:DNA-binding response OmpR family regulator
MKDRIVLICDSDEKVLQQLKEELTQSEFPVETTTDATALVSKALAHPCILLVNPEMRGFNEYDVCKKLKKEGNTPVLFLLDAHSTYRAKFSDCEADDVLTKPVKKEDLVSLLTKHYTVTSNTK